jgi:hypothetical protein
VGPVPTAMSVRTLLSALNSRPTAMSVRTLLSALNSRPTAMSVMALLNDIAVGTELASD